MRVINLTIQDYQHKIKEYEELIHAIYKGTGDPEELTTGKMKGYIICGSLYVRKEIYDRMCKIVDEHKES
jgi:hypothetical protein